MEILNKEEMAQIRGGAWVYVEREQRWFWIEGDEGKPVFPPQPKEEQEPSKPITNS